MVHIFLVLGQSLSAKREIFVTKDVIGARIQLGAVKATQSDALAFVSQERQMHNE